jgi:Protein kinase domain
VISAPVVLGYEMFDAIGQGGFGTVYRARQLTVGREVALKIDNRVLTTERDRRRFLREVSSAGHLSGHPHVVDLYDAGTLPDGRPYLVMELCPGGSLESMLHQRGHLPFGQVREIGVGIADALAAAHAAGVLHRDVKPANILVNRYGVVGLSDFGLASILDADGAQSATREALTPAYAAPEAFELADPAPAADVYSLAATLYALLSGLPPRFPPGARPGIATIMRLHHAPVPDIVGVPRELVDVLRAGLVTDPARRLPSATALRDALAAVRLDGAPVAPAPGAATPLWAPTAATTAEAPGAPGAEPTVTAAGPGSWQPPQPAPGTLPFPLQPTAADLPPGHPSGGGYGAPAAPATSAPAHPAPGATPRRSRRRTTLLVVAVLALLVAATATWTVLGRGGSPSASAGGTTSGGTATGGTATGGTATGAPSAPPSGRSGSGETPAGSSQVAGHPVTACAATADIPGTGCPVTPECWAGTVNVSGLMSASPLDCAGVHTWETFAIGSMPAQVIAGGVPDQSLVIVSAQAKRLCSTAVLTRAMSAAARRIPVSAWEIDVLTPTQNRFDHGDHTFRCIAMVSAMSSRGSAFSPTATSYATQTPSS